MLSMGPILKTNIFEIINVDRKENTTLIIRRITLFCLDHQKQLFEVFAGIHLANLYKAMNTCTSVRTTQGI